MIRHLAVAIVTLRTMITMRLASPDRLHSIDTIFINAEGRWLSYGRQSLCLLGQEQASGCNRC
jgi:hypothetical protein